MSQHASLLNTTTIELQATWKGATHMLMKSFDITDHWRDRDLGSCDPGPINRYEALAEKRVCQQPGPGRAGSSG